MKRFVSLVVVLCGALALAGCADDEAEEAKIRAEETKEKQVQEHTEDVINVASGGAGSQMMSSGGKVRASGTSREQIAKDWVNGVGQAYVHRYSRINGELPENIEGLLKDHPRHGPIAMEKDLKDPWGNQYQYKKTGVNKFELWTITPYGINVSSAED